MVSYNPEDATTKILWEGIGRIWDIAKLPSGDLLVVIDKNSLSEGYEGRLIKLAI